MSSFMTCNEISNSDSTIVFVLFFYFILLKLIKIINMIEIYYIKDT